MILAGSKQIVPYEIASVFRLHMAWNHDGLAEA
jgi:hypothetical protein